VSIGNAEEAAACWLILTAVRKSMLDAARMVRGLLEVGILLGDVCRFSGETLLVEW
jgi:hypothetical protein